MHKRARGWLVAAVLVGLGFVIVLGIVTAEERPTDRVAALSAQLRCPVCQSESVWDSPSETARAIRLLIGDQVAEGRTDEEIRSFFVARYGEWILLDPPATGRGLVLWLIPAIVLVVGSVLAVGRRRRTASRELTPDERALVAAEFDRRRHDVDDGAS